MKSIVKLVKNRLMRNNRNQVMSRWDIKHRYSHLVRVVATSTVQNRNSCCLHSLKLCKKINESLQIVRIYASETKNLSAKAKISLLRFRSLLVRISRTSNVWRRQKKFSRIKRRFCRRERQTSAWKGSKRLVASWEADRIVD